MREKLMNMVVWLETELGKQSVDLEQYVARRTETEIACVAGILSTNSALVEARDWDGLVALGDCPRELRGLFLQVRERKDLHDKFWRYLELFVCVISNAQS